MFGWHQRVIGSLQSLENVLQQCLRRQPAKTVRSLWAGTRDEVSVNVAGVVGLLIDDRQTKFFEFFAQLNRHVARQIADHRGLFVDGVREQGDFIALKDKLATIFCLARYFGWPTLRSD